MTSTGNIHTVDDIDDIVPAQDVASSAYCRRVPRLLAAGHADTLTKATVDIL